MVAYFPEKISASIRNSPFGEPQKALPLPLGRWLIWPWQGLVPGIGIRRGSGKEAFGISKETAL